MYFSAVVRVPINRLNVEMCAAVENFRQEFVKIHVTDRSIDSRYNIRNQNTNRISYRLNFVMGKSVSVLDKKFIDTLSSSFSHTESAT